jgi:uncharacterized protein
LTQLISDHIKNLKSVVDSGFLLMGGATLDEPIKEGEGPKINGSALIALAESKEEVLEKLKEDVYYKTNVWDADKVSWTVGKGMHTHLTLG